MMRATNSDDEPSSETCTMRKVSIVCGARNRSAIDVVSATPAIEPVQG